MLPAVAPQARIMRYGYQSQWFGEGAMRQTVSTVAQRLLLALRRKRTVKIIHFKNALVVDLVRHILSVKLSSWHIASAA